jgi:pilus assembly protein CpaF
MSLPDRGFVRRQLTRPGNPSPQPVPFQTEQPQPAAPSTPPVAADLGTADRPRAVLNREVTELKYRIHERMIREIDPTRLTADLSPEDARRAVGDSVLQLLALEGASISRSDELTLMREIADEIVGLGPLEPLLQDDSITEIMVNGPQRVFFERNGTLHVSDRSFRDDAHIMRLIEKIISPLGRRIDESSPMVDARLSDGSRVNAVIPPLAIHGPSLTIRKFARRAYTDVDLVEIGTINQAMCVLLRACVWSRLNILVSGGTGSGKTTFLNVLSSYIRPNERVVTIEDPAELQLKQANWVSLETRPANIEGRGQVIQRDLVRNSLRMRPDRIIVGECRAGEAFDMLQAMNTGHDGSLTTVHANSPRDALARIENMVLMANLELPVRAIRDQISSAINLVVQLARLPDGTRRVTHITEIVGTEQDVITMHDIFTFEQRGVDPEGRIIGEMKPTGIRPTFADRLERSGAPLPFELFQGRR